MYEAEGTLVRWLKPSGSSVEAGEVVAEIETEKVLAEVIAPVAGVLHHVATPGTHLEVESVMGYVLAPGEAVPVQEAQEPAKPAHAAVPDVVGLDAPSESRSAASPNARRLAAELGVDLADLAGSGPGGRIREDDVRAAAERGSS